MDFFYFYEAPCVEIGISIEGIQEWEKNWLPEPHSQVPLYLIHFFSLYFFSLHKIDDNSLISLTATNIDMLDSVKLTKLSAGINDSKHLTNEALRKKCDTAAVSFWKLNINQKRHTMLL